MSNVLLCASPIYGHVAPMITIGRHLVGAGHRVRMITGSRFADIVAAAGMEHIALPAGADFDDRNVAQTFPLTEKLTGVRRLRYDIENVFVSVMPHQYRGVREQIDREPVDAILSETAFTGVIPLLVQEARTRPPVLICGVLPLSLSSRDTAPFGLGLQPSSSAFGRMRNRVLNFLVSHIVFGRAQKLAQGYLRELGVPPMSCFVLDGPSLSDHVLQLTSAGFEYPRSDLRTELSFVGAVLPAMGSFEPPAWWSELDGERPVVHVTQGTIANGNLDALIMPTITALAQQDVLVVATTGDEDSARALARTVPANVRVAAFLPYDQLLPKVDVMVTNGGYGGVQFALAAGVPLVVAGDTEDKPEIAARVTWSGVGVNVRTGSPSSKAVGNAVGTILADPEYRRAAQRLQDELAISTPLETIEQQLQQAVSQRRANQVTAHQ